MYVFVAVVVVVSCILLLSRGHPCKLLNPVIIKIDPRQLEIIIDVRRWWWHALIVPQMPQRNTEPFGLSLLGARKKAAALAAAAAPIVTARNDRILIDQIGALRNMVFVQIERGILVIVSTGERATRIAMAIARKAHIPAHLPLDRPARALPAPNLSCHRATCLARFCFVCPPNQPTTFAVCVLPRPREFVDQNQAAWKAPGAHCTHCWLQTTLVFLHVF